MKESDLILYTSEDGEQQGERSVIKESLTT